MRLALKDVPAAIRAWRELTGADRWDEVWEGVLHMGPNPSLSHQRSNWCLETVLNQLWAPRVGGRVYHDASVVRPGTVAGPGTWPDDYRIPDLVLLLPDRFDRAREAYVDGGPNAVVELRSRGDESYAKLPFYAELDVSEVWILDRDTRALELFVLSSNGYAVAAPQANGWVQSAVTGLELRTHEMHLELRWPDRVEDVSRVPFS